MTDTRPRGLWARRAQRLLTKAKGLRSVADRVEFFSKCFLGSPYETNPLGGAPGTPEVLTALLEGFDCVTYVESVLALSLSTTSGEFVDWLRRIRYVEGQVSWAHRNHYMTGWVRQNKRAGVVKSIAAGVPGNHKSRVLDVVPGIPARRTRFLVVPRSKLERLQRRLRTGDLIFFASTRRRLDVFHCGILVRRDDRLWLRHAAGGRKSVVEQGLSEFLAANRMAGVLVVRSADPSVEARKRLP
jgi:cell wall-associated NlpC family hydrolase